MKPEHPNLELLGPDYDWVASENVPVWPGYMIMHVYRHWRTGTHWAINEYMDDETSRYGEHWYQVVPRTVITYEKKAS
jgi:hypothetical protein